MSKQVLARNKILPKDEFDKIATLPVIWNDQQIPPLVSLSNPKQPQKISIQSLNQSEVKSVYTVDRQDFGRNVLQMMNSTSRTQKQAKSQRIPIQPVVITQSKQSNQAKLDQTFQTPININKINDFESTRRKDMFSSFEEGYGDREGDGEGDGDGKEEKEIDYRRCEAVKLYREIVQSKVREDSQERTVGQFQYEWMIEKKPSELLANVLTNPSRLNLYVHYLLNQIYLNEQAKIINQLYQQPVKPYNPCLKETYQNILCILGKLTSARDQRRGVDLNSTLSKQKNVNVQSNGQKLKVSLFQNGISIDLNPKLNDLKRQKAARIRTLKNSIRQSDLEISEINKYYQEIITNLAIVIENLKRDQLQVPQEKIIQESMVKLVTEPQQEETIRNKNHTFGMRDISQRSSKEEKRWNLN